MPRLIFENISNEALNSILNLFEIENKDENQDEWLDARGSLPRIDRIKHGSLNNEFGENQEITIYCE